MGCAAMQQGSSTGTTQAWGRETTGVGTQATGRVLVQGAGCGKQMYGAGRRAQDIKGARCRMWDAGSQCRTQGARHTACMVRDTAQDTQGAGHAGHMAQGAGHAGHTVQDTQDSGCKTCRVHRAGRKVQETQDRGHTGHAGCRTHGAGQAGHAEHTVQDTGCRVQDTWCRTCRMEGGGCRTQDM